MLSRKVIRAPHCAAVLVVAALAACGGDNGTQPPGSLSVAVLTVVSGTDQQTVVGSALPVRVRATTADGRPVAGVSLVWAADDDGSVDPSQGSTDANGEALASWRVPVRTGLHHLSITIAQRSTVTATATVRTVAGAPAAIRMGGGNGQVVVVGRMAAAPLSATVEDRYGNPVSGVAVTWWPDTAAGSLSDVQTTTDSSGMTTARWTMPTRAHPVQAHATPGGAVVADFTATAIPDAPAAVQAVSGDRQDGPYGVLLADPLVVSVTDRYGNGVPRVQLSVTVDGGGSAASPLTTDTTGTARTRLRLPVTFGTVSATIAAPGATPARFTARSRAAVFASVSGGGGAMCALTVEGYPYCWGDNGHHRLGVVDSMETTVTMPMPLAAGLQFSKIDVGQMLACGITPGKELWCWGDPFDYTVGQQPGGVPIHLAPGVPFASVSLGWFAHCALDTAGTAYCWGINNRGEIGIPGGTSSRVPLPLNSSFAFRSIATGDNHACGVDVDGVAWCWGEDDRGQLGAPAPPTCYKSEACSSTPIRVATDQHFVAISSRGPATCGLTADGSAYCWGDPAFGRLGAGMGSGEGPVRVASDEPIAALSVGDFGACALGTSGYISCWGTNIWWFGASTPDACPIPSSTPQQTMPCSATPWRLTAAGRFTTVSTEGGLATLCGFALAGGLYCWGLNSNGTVGDASQTMITSPTRVLGQQ